MPTRSRIAAALISSAYTPAFLAAFITYFFIPAGPDDVATQSALMFGVIFTLALLHALILGLPFYLLLRRKEAVTPLSLALGGFVIGVLPIVTLVMIATGGDSTISEGDVPMIVDGVRTAAGWLSFGKMVLKLGVFGALGGLTFWWVLTRMRAEKAS